MKYIISLLFLLSSFVSLQAQSSFSGTVRDRNKKALSGAQVVLLKADTVFAVTLVDKAGKFSIRELPEGIYDLQISCQGYTPLYEKERKIKGHRSFQFVLEKEMNVDLDVVEVVGDRSYQVKRTATGKIFYLSEAAKKSGDPYQALQEIPSLITNSALKKITMVNGSSPLILIDGIAVNSGVDPIDPKDIESVEVMDVVSARYLRTGARHILNIKLKKNRAPYRYFETMTRHDVPLHVGMGAVYFEVGNPTYSLYGRAAGGYTYNDDVRLSGWQQGENYFKQSNSASRSNDRNFLGELLFKWRPSEKDYLAFHIYTKNGVQKGKTNGEGTWQSNGTEQQFDYFANNLDKTNLLTSTLYQKHNFDEEDKVLETTLAINKNWNINDGERNEDYSDWLYRNIYKFDNQRLSGTLNLDYSWNLSETNSLNIGSETRYLNDKIDQTTSLNPVFKHREWSEYLYGSFSGKVQNLYYMLSAGVEGFWLKAGDESGSYIKPRASVSGTYSINDNNSVQLSYTLTNSAPAIAQLNPYNTSTDSLVITRGNPGLLPEQTNRLDASYTYNWKGLYLTPSVIYTFFNDIIMPSGYTQNDIYISTYRNMGKYQWLSLFGSVSYRLGNWGRLYGYVGHGVQYYKNQDHRKWVSYGGGLYARYKKWSLDFTIEGVNKVYTNVSKTRYHTPTYSYVQLMYNFTPDFYISLAVQYLNGPQHSDVLTYSDTYRAFSSQKQQDLSWRPWFLIRYKFRKNVKKKIKLGNVISGSRESGIKL